MGASPQNQETVAERRPLDVQQPPVKTGFFKMTDEPVVGAVMTCIDEEGRGKWDTPSSSPGGKMYAYDNFT